MGVTGLEPPQFSSGESQVAGPTGSNSGNTDARNGDPPGAATPDGTRGGTPAPTRSETAGPEPTPQPMRAASRGPATPAQGRPGAHGNAAPSDANGGVGTGGRGESSELAEVARAWPNLPAAIRAAALAMIRASGVSDPNAGKP
ncbi:hypothetical protein RAS1_03600 [Phycisphaerae bacterium RAS1]|nr:hypothetical protein RAS1_03600 [Phycisphaerae bacterium RAS1]